MARFLGRIWLHSEVQIRLPEMCSKLPVDVRKTKEVSYRNSEDDGVTALLACLSSEEFEPYLVDLWHRLEDERFQERDYALLRKERRELKDFLV